jgi:hypothetical protein
VWQDLSRSDGGNRDRLRVLEARRGQRPTSRFPYVLVRARAQTPRTLSWSPGRRVRGANAGAAAGGGRHQGGQLQ